MASSNVELVRSIYAAWERGDFSATGWAHPEIEFVIADGPAPGEWTGVDEMSGAWRDFLGAWDDYHVEATEYRELDNERVLALLSVGGRGKTSGLEVGQARAEGANLFHVVDGRVTRLLVYFDRERALDDLGRSPEKAS
jgi:ketosteroid isomerase-like protein